ncbi:hypothetical protein LSAT2_002349 [Lamellibrachia satsuma]|nr:hypothetical protein LSAT2_002349 [Lamellibrachia satsuma]
MWRARSEGGHYSVYPQPDDHRKGPQPDDHREGPQPDDHREGPQPDDHREDHSLMTTKRDHSLMTTERNHSLMTTKRDHSALQCLSNVSNSNRVALRWSKDYYLRSRVFLSCRLREALTLPQRCC